MRLFVGVELDDPVRAACAAATQTLQARLKRARVKLDARWVPEDNLHITLWFLGNIDDAQAAAVTESLRSEWVIPRFAIDVSGGGFFPPSGPPRILWLGVGDGTHSLGALHRELTVRLTPLGFEAERRPYHAHLTVARVKNADRSATRKMRGILESADLRCGRSAVGSVTLFRSHVSSAGARYEPLLRVPLKEC